MNRNITAIILIVLAVGIYLTFTRGKIAEIQAVRAVNDQYLTAIDNADELIKVRDKVSKQNNDISDDDRKNLDKMLPNTVDNIRLIIDLNSIAMTRHSLQLRNIKAAASSASKNAAPTTPRPQEADMRDQQGTATIPTPVLDTVSVSFSVSASYQQFIDLLRDLEANLRIMDITHLSVSASQTPGGLYDFGVELRTYWLRQQ